MSDLIQLYVGFDPREISAYLVTTCSFMRHSPGLGEPEPVELNNLRGQGWYTRPTEIREGRLFDVISQHPMATEFAISRFMVPILHKWMHGSAGVGWAMFTDCDMLNRWNVYPHLEALLSDEYAVMCVKHDHRPTGTTKMVGQVQSRYNKKNWSSVCLFNCDHPSNSNLTLELINSVPGRDLHAFCWLKEEEIGELPPAFNYLVGTTKGVENPGIVHFTEGTPHMSGYEDCEYAQEWVAALRRATPEFLRTFGSLRA